jgi:hypothetical protein
MTDSLVEPEAPDDDLIYRRVVRSLYVIGLALNVWLIWEMVKDSPGVKTEIARGRAWWKAHVTDCEGCAKRKKQLRAKINRTLWEAEQIISEVPDDRHID